MILKKIRCKILVRLHMAVAINTGLKGGNMETQLDVAVLHWENIKWPTPTMEDLVLPTNYMV